MAILKSTVLLLLAMSSQVLALPMNKTEPIKPEPCKLPIHGHRDRSSFAELAPTKRPIHHHRVHSSFAELASTESPLTKGPIVDHPAHHPPAGLASTTLAPKTTHIGDHPAHYTPAAMPHTEPAISKRPDPSELALDEPSPTTPLASTTVPNTAASSPSLPPPYLTSPTAPPSGGLDLSPDPEDPYMIGQPTFFCNYRFQLSGRKDHYFLRGRNWNITGEQLEDAVQKVVYNTAEWGASPVGGADKDGEYLPGWRVDEDTISFKYSDTYVPDGINPGGIQEFAAEVSLSFFLFIPPLTHRTYF